MNKKNLYIMFILFVYFKPDWLNNITIATYISQIFLLIKIFVTLYYIPKSIVLYKINKIDLLIFFFLFSQTFAAFITQTLYLNYIGGQFFLLGLYQRKDESSNIELEINEIDNKNIYFYINTNLHSVAFSARFK